MRFARLAALALWAMVALLAVAGFAAFSPETAPTTTTSSIVAAPVATGADWGTTSGRVVAFAFSSGLRSAPGISELSSEEALISDLFEERPPVTTTTAPEEDEVESALSTVATPPTATLPTTTTPPAPTRPTVPATTTTTQPQGGEMSETETRGIIAVFFAPEDVDLAMKVAYCESRWDPAVTNRSSGAAGLFQHIPSFWSERAAAAGWAGANVYDAHANTAVSAWLVYEGGGWIHWTASQGCWG